MAPRPDLQPGGLFPSPSMRPQPTPPPPLGVPGPGDPSRVVILIIMLDEPRFMSEKIHAPPKSFSLFFSASSCLVQPPLPPTRPHKHTHLDELCIPSSAVASGLLAVCLSGSCHTHPRQAQRHLRDTPNTHCVTGRPAGRQSDTLVHSQNGKTDGCALGGGAD